jgi:hypothetical protein
MVALGSAHHRPGSAYGAFLGVLPNRFIPWQDVAGDGQYAQIQVDLSGHAPLPESSVDQPRVDDE